MNGFMTFLRNWTLPVAIFVGTVFYLVFAYTPSLDAAGDALLPVFETLLPLSIFCTLFITFSKVDFHLMRLRRWHLYILLTQLLLVALLTALTLYIVHCPLSILHFQFSILNFQFSSLNPSSSASSHLVLPHRPW